MATAITGIPTTRVSDLFIRQRLLGQVQFDQGELFRLQMQLATGRRFETPSEAPVAALRIMSLQGLLERKSQVASNLSTNQTYLSNTEVTVSSVANTMAEVRATALGVLGTTATDDQRRAAAQQVGQALQSLIETGNQMFRGRYLFAGTRTSVRPFTSLPDGTVRYDGNEGHIQSYADIDLLFDTNVHGGEVFGALSEPVRGAVDLDPNLTHDTRIADLRAGQGISKGSIQISDGSEVSTIDLSSAETIGDVAALIKAHPPEGRELYVEVTSTTLRIQLAGATGNLSIHEVGSGTVAHELGILRGVGVGTQPIEGRDLDPVLRGTTALDDVLGVRARAVLHSPGTDNDIRIVADEPGEALNGLNVAVVDDPDVTAGNEYAEYDPGDPDDPDSPPTMTVYIRAGASTAADVVAAVNAFTDAEDLPYTAMVDRLDDVNGGRGAVMAGAAAVVAEGRGEAFDRRGLRIENKNGFYDVDFETARTVEDLLNKLNGFGAGVLAEINRSRTGIDLRSRVSGSDFMIGENGGGTAAQLGLRTFTLDTRLEDLNYGRGIHPVDGTDFTITLADGEVFEVDVSGLTTIDEVIEHLKALAPDKLEARPAEYGNGITLIDASGGAGTLKVEREVTSTAAVELGLIPAGQSSATGRPAGGEQILEGRDVRPLETESLFTALIRLQHALEADDVGGVQRAVEMLDRKVVDLNFARAELGARQQSLDLLQYRIDTEEIELRSVLSLEYDADLAEVVSNLTGRQAAFEASLRSMGSILRVSLLDYL